LITVTVADLKPNPQETSAFYLENIYKNQLINQASNASELSLAVTPVNPPLFSPPNYVIWVNSLWFLSFTISLTCALLVSMLQQWARRYLWMTQKSRWNPHDGARMRAFFAHGAERLRFSSVAEAIPSLIHISLFLFFAGLLIYLFNINHTPFFAVVWWIAAFAAAYLVITIMPLLQVDSPYYSPLSSLVFRVYAGILYLSFFSKRLRSLTSKYSIGFSRGIEKLAGEEITKGSTRIDSLILKWTFNAHAFASDDQLDRFFVYIHGFYTSKGIVRDPLRSLATLGSRKFSSALVAFLNRTLSSSSVDKSEKVQRFIMCVRIADETQGTAFWDLFSETADQSVVRSVDVGRCLRSPNRIGEEIGLCAQTIVADIIAKVEERDGRWIELAADQLGKSENDIIRYLAQGDDSLLLANLIHIARKISNVSSGINRSMAGDAASCILQPASKFDIRNTLPELQHGFCSLWNEIVQKAQKTDDGSIFHFIVFLLRRLYIDLHRDSDDSSSPIIDKFQVLSYPLCTNPDHRLRESSDTPLTSLIPALTTLYMSPPGYTSHPPKAILPPISPENDIVLGSSAQVAGASTTSQHNKIATGPQTNVHDPPSSAAILPLPSSQPAGDLRSPADSSG
jgi:Family of unknown function (DUF6535)